MEIPGYRVEKEIGKGGMATVYLATQESLDRAVVLKILDHAGRNQSNDLTQRFLDEGRIIAALHHPNIVTIYDIGTAGDDIYISMEYVEGGDLKSRLQKHFKPEQTLNIISSIASALASAHSHNIIHRDVKPGNILFRKDDTPLLSDFGIAKQTDTDNNLTATHVFMGSPNYVSPEQAEGAYVDGRSDIYSLGCIFFEMLTGYKPYHSRSVIDIVMQHRSAPIPSLPDSLAEYQPLLNKMMAKTPDERFASADEVVHEIETLLSRKKQAEQTNVVTPGVYSKKATISVLVILLVLSSVFFFSLQFVEIRIKRGTTVKFEDSMVPAVNAAPSTAIEPELPSLPSETDIDSVQEPMTNPESVEKPAPGSEDVIKALEWLGTQSLREERLDSPPNDNALYYFTKLLKMQPDNVVAYKGILSIAESYAGLAERALATDNVELTRTYVNRGLEIDPNNESLLLLQSLLNKQTQGIWGTIMSIFKG